MSATRRGLFPRRNDKGGKLMSELNMVSPLLSNMEVVSCVSKHGGASVYIVRSTKSQARYILKHISVPESQRQIDALRYSGAANTDEEAQKYYEQVVEDYKAELETLESLAGHANIACYRSYQIEPKQDAVGFDLYLLAEDRMTLKDHLEQSPMTHLSAVNLAIDLCDALIDLRAAGFVHRDVKPSNIYLNVQNHFVIGDLGLAKLEELKYCSMPENMISIYSAPELFSLVGTIDPTADIYSVGLILYRIFNGNHAPFEDEKTSARAADKQRITGEALPAPMYADYEMTEILLKACAFKPEDRYATPEEFKDALVEYTKRNQLDESLIVPPIVADDEPVDFSQEEEEIEPVQFADVDEMPDDFKESFSPDTQMLNSIIDAVHRDMENDPADETVSEEDEDGEEIVRKRHKKKKFLFLIPIAAILAVAAAVYFLIIAPSTIHVDSITLVSQESTVLSVNVDSPEKDGSFGVLCSDAYGNTYRQSFIGSQNNVFTDLVPGTQYTITVEPLNDEKLTGDYTLRVSTIAETEILSFTVTPVSITQVEINLTVDGPEPSAWGVRYYADGVEEKSVAFIGHSATIADLESDSDYTFELMQPEGIHLTGPTTAEYSTVPTVDITGTTVALSSSTAILSWTIEGTAPEAWTVDIEGESGYTDTQIVSSTTATFEGLTSGEEYTIIISAPTMLQSGKVTIVPTVVEISELKAEIDADGNCKVDWTPVAEPADNSWIVSWKPVGAKDEAARTAEVVDANTYTIAKNDMLPGMATEIKLALANDDKLNGTTTANVTTAASNRFKSYGLNQIYIGMYLRPEQEDWTYLNLNTATSSYKPSQFVAFALQTVQALQASEDEIDVTLVVLDAATGKVIDAETTTYKWDDMWEKSLFVSAFPRTPQEAGSYKLGIYFNGQPVIESPFTILPS